MIKILLKSLYSFIFRLLQPLFIYPPGKKIGKEYLSISRVAIMEFLNQWHDRMHGKVLDVGVGTWEYPRELLHDVCEYISTDCFAHPNIDVVCDITNLQQQFTSDQFDFVLCTDVLEHVERPWLAVKQLHSVIKPGGYLLLTTPFNYYLHTNQYVKDYWRFSSDGLRLLLIMEAGFQKVDCTSIGHPKFPYSFTVVARK